MSDYKRVHVIILDGPFLHEVKVLDGPKYVAVNWAKGMLKFYSKKKRAYRLGGSPHETWYVPNGVDRIWTAVIELHVLHTRDELEFSWADKK